MNWGRLITQILATLSALMASGNLGRLTTPEAGAGPLDLVGWVGVPAALAAAGVVGQSFLGGPAADGKPGSPGHAEFCQSVYELAKSLELDRLRALVDAWQKTAPTEPPKP